MSDHDVDDLETPLADPFQDGGQAASGGFLAFTLLLVLHLWQVWPAQVLPLFERAVEGDPAPAPGLGAAP